MDSRGAEDVLERQRTALRLRAQGMSLQFIGRELGITDTGVHKLLKRARE